MKKIYVTTIVILSLVLTVNSQDIKFGAKGGINFASASGDIKSTGSRTALHFGGMAEIPLSTEFYLQPELLFSSQGYKVANGTGTLNYLNLPIIGKYYVNEELSIEAGPQIGYLLSATIQVDNINTGGNTNTPTTGSSERATNAKSSNANSSAVSNNAIEQDISNFFNSTDISFGIGAGYKLENGINISARYNFGLSNISSDSSENVKNSLFMLSVGYFFF
ncbi:porin family protein [uncultured Algibacter sp.]|uniref:porin family protein n=1 Tax=uncultured Algibacter sp. TaxID=298659 RepID=UPI002631F57E|nr:porin family protein [uncultured Algibacter sp.]